MHAPIGARPVAPGSVRFEVWAPNAERVALRLDGNEIAMEPLDRGYHRATTEASHGSRYTFLLNGVERPDPASRWQPDGVHSPSAVVDPATFAWTDDEWTGIRMADCIFYELHIGTFTSEGTFDAAIEHIPYLVELGVTAVEVMPIAQFPGHRNWGYDGVYPYAVQSTYGGPEGFARLVDACHAHGLAVCLDVVYNHLGPEGSYHRDFGPYFTDLYRTPWGEAINFDDAGSDEVRRYFVGNALQWFRDYHVDILRLDAIHGIVDRSAYPFLAELNDEVRELERELRRPLLLVSESDLNDVRVITGRDDNGYGHDAQWADDFHHSVHSIVTGETDGYYADFGSHDDLAEALRKGWIYDGRYSRHRQRRHGNPPDGLPPERFVVCVQNHDQVGNRAEGERLSALADHDRLRVAAGLMLLSPFVPLLFMGEEYGETAPFLYFIDHSDPDLLEAVRTGRREEFSSFGWEGEVPDPADATTFERSRIDLALRHKEGHRELFDLYRELLRLRREHPALRHGGVKTMVDGDLIWLERSGDGVSVRACFNLSDQARAVPAPAGELLVTSDDTRWGGPGAHEGAASGDDGWTLHPWSFTAWTAPTT
ncbi:MAG TPA: malto-oligosyltrehalose trehalohydrolase [Actinomycetota bacterium]|nr:malto-oligosyltrehalose trehalohydrolase [Actinomycetota bacterium]